MKNYISIASIVFTAIFALALYTAAQTPPPPPPAAKQLNTKKWESAEGGFKISFPANPTSAVRSFEGSFGPTNIYAINLATTFAHYSVSYFDFPTAITDKYDLDTRFDLMRDEQAKRLSARVMHDSELIFGTFYGRDSVLETVSQTVSMRTLVAGPRLFIFIVVTKGRQSALAPTVAAANKKRIEDFLHSFEITKLPEATAQQVKLPADFQVTASNSAFSSAVLGVSMTPPVSWVISESKDSELLLELGKDEIKKTDARLASYLSNENTRILALYTKSGLDETVPDAFLFLIAEQAPYPNFAPSAIAKTFEKLYLDRTEKIVKPISSVQLGGKAFSWLETYDSQSKMYHRLFVANVKGMAFEASLIYARPEDLQTILKSLETMKFAQ